MLKVAVITGFLGELRDRFCTYGQARTAPEKVRAAARIRGVSGLELVYPYDFQDRAALAEALRETGLGVSAVNVNVKGEPEFAAGSLTSPEAAIRRKAVDFLKRGMEAARLLGCNRVTVCPLSDGHDYPFQADYRADWRLMAGCLAEAASHDAGVTLSLEYKPSETRARSTLGGAYRSILLVKELGLPNLGVTLDIGHSLYGGENPAEALAMLDHYGIKPYIHVNDNYRNWDWDLIPGAVNPWDLLEVFWTAWRMGYDDWYTLDVFPARMDPEACFAASARIIQALAAAARKIDPGVLARMREEARELGTAGITAYIFEQLGIDL